MPDTDSGPQKHAIAMFLLRATALVWRDRMKKLGDAETLDSLPAVGRDWIV